jgi:N-methylhydantoinase A
MSFGGPAIVETAGTTTVVHPGNEVTVDAWGNLVIELKAAAEQAA